MENRNQIAKRKETTLQNTSERKQKALQVFNPENCYRISNKIKSVSDAIKMPSKTLGQFKREFGRQWTVDYLCLWLVDLNNNAQVKNKMSEAQIDFTAERIFDTYALKVTDLTLFFRNVKEGVYGSYYETISQEKIMQWIAEYWEERCLVGEMQSQGRNDKFSMTKDKVNPEVIEKMFKGVGEIKIDHTGKGEGVGSRLKNSLDNSRNKKIIEYHETITAISDEDLKEYCTTVDVNDNDFDKLFYDMAWMEYEKRKK